MGNGILSQLGINAELMVVVLLVLWIISFIILIVLLVKYNTMKASYTMFMKGSDGESLEEQIGSLFNDIAVLKLSSEKKKEQAILRSGTLAEKNPNLAKEWHPLKNGEQTPEMITSGSDQKAWWLCRKCGHEWKASVGSRHRGAGCPVCAREKRKKSK